MHVVDILFCGDDQQTKPVSVGQGPTKEHKRCILDMQSLTSVSSAAMLLLSNFEVNVCQS